jgi:demethylsterigmatocystin 6-O-methyltransferase
LAKDSLLVKMDAIIAQVENLAKTADEAGRRKMIESLRNVQFAIETPNDMLRRLCGLVSDIRAYVSV